MELDRKVRWKCLRDELFGVITNSAHSPDDMIERIKSYRKGLYETPKVYEDGYAVNDGSWVKYYYNGRFRCKNKEEIGRYIYGYVCFLIKAGIDDLDEFWYYSLCFLIDRLEYREGLFGCSLENRRRLESTIRKACMKRPQEVWTTKKDERGYCSDPKVMKERTKGLKERKEIIGEKTRLQKENQKKKTDEIIRKYYDHSKSLGENVKWFAEIGHPYSKGRLSQWRKENGFV